MIPVTTAEVQIWFLVHVGVLLVGAGWMTVSTLFLPGVTTRGARRLERAPWLVFLLGLGLMIVAAIVIGGLSIVPSPPVNFIALVLGALTVILSLLGSGGLIRALVASTQEKRSSSLPSLVRVYGVALVVALTWLLPLAGWFFALPMTLILGLGTLVVGFFPMKPPEASSEQ